MVGAEQNRYMSNIENIVVRMNQDFTIMLGQVATIKMLTNHI